MTSRMIRWLREPVACLAGMFLLVFASGCDREGGSKESGQAPAEPTPTVIVAEIPQQTVQVSGEFVARTEAVPTVEKPSSSAVS